MFQMWGSVGICGKGKKCIKMETHNYVGSVVVSTNIDDMNSKINNIIDDILIEELELSVKRVQKRLDDFGLNCDVSSNY